MLLFDTQQIGNRLLAIRKRRMISLQKADLRPQKAVMGRCWPHMGSRWSRTKRYLKLCILPICKFF